MEAPLPGRGPKRPPAPETSPHDTSSPSQLSLRELSHWGESPGGDLSDSREAAKSSQTISDDFARGGAKSSHSGDKMKLREFPGAESPHGKPSQAGAVQKGAEVRALR